MRIRRVTLFFLKPWSESWLAWLRIRKILFKRSAWRSSLRLVSEHSRCRNHCRLLNDLAIAVVDLATLIRGDGLRFILQIFENGPYNLTQPLTPVLISLINTPDDRRLLPPDTGLGAIFSGFTNAYGSGPVHIDRLRSTSANALTVLRSWPGK